MTEHLTDRDLAQIKADPEVTRMVGLMVFKGEVELGKAVDWLEDDVLTRADIEHGERDE